MNNEEAKQIKCYCGHTTMCDCSPIEEPKQETLEEVAENYGNSIGNKNGTAQFDFIRGAKWQAERMYSEEDMKLAFDAGHKKGFSGYPNTENWKELPFNEWFEQFKKK